MQCCESMPQLRLYRLIATDIEPQNAQVNRREVVTEPAMRRYLQPVFLIRARDQQERVFFTAAGIRTFGPDDIGAED